MKQRSRKPLIDLVVLLGYLTAAFVVLNGLWLDLSSGYLRNSMQDQYMWEWFFAATAKSIVHLDNPLSSVLQNHPLGVNLMANTAMLGVGIPLTPVTILCGPTATLAVVLTGGLAGTAMAWYWLLSRHCVRSRLGAAIPGAFCGFAPPIISHANGHPNFVALFVIPLIALWVLKLANGEHPVRNGVLLGLIITYQVFLGEEPLLIAVTAFAVFGFVYCLSRPIAIETMFRPVALGLGVAACVLVALLAFPLWWQFLGPQSYGSLEHGSVGNDAAAFTSFASQSVSGDSSIAGRLSMNRTEENAFFGWPLLVLVLAVSAWLFRNVVARAVSVAMVVMAWLSMGVVVMVNDSGTSIPGLWLLLFRLPLYESLLESRFAIACVPLVAVLIALATDRVLAAKVAIEWRFFLRLLWFCTLALALAPTIPVPLETTKRADTPAFFADGTWRNYVDDGSVVIAPLPDAGDAKALGWQAGAGMNFPLAEGYFVGPSDTEGHATYGAVRRPTSTLLKRVADSGRAARIRADDRAAIGADLRFWNADVVVLAQSGMGDALRETLDELLPSRGVFVEGAWVWDVRAMTG